MHPGGGARIGISAEDGATDPDKNDESAFNDRPGFFLTALPHL